MTIFKWLDWWYARYTWCARVAIPSMLAASLSPRSVCVGRSASQNTSKAGRRSRQKFLRFHQFWRFEIRRPKTCVLDTLIVGSGHDLRYGRSKPVMVATLVNAIHSWLKLVLLNSHSMTGLDVKLIIISHWLWQYFENQTFINSIMTGRDQIT